MTKSTTVSLQRMTFTMVLLNAFTTPLMLSAVNVSLPSIATALSMDAILLSWIPMAYLTASAMFVLIFGRIADTVGRKRLFLIGTAGVIVTSLFAAFAVNGIMLIAARFLQGVCAAMLYATQVAIVSSVFPPPKRGQAIGITISMIYCGLMIGPLLGGYAIELFGWRAVFLVHIPLAIFVLWIGLVYVKEEWRAETPVVFDKIGAVVYALSIFIACFAVSILPTTLGFVFLIASMLGFGFFFLFERAQKQPLLNVQLFFTNRIFTYSCLAALIIYTATFANVVQISLYLQYLKGLSASQAGLIMMCQPLVMALFSPLAGHLSDKIEARYLTTAGMLLSFFGLLLLANLHSHSTLHYLIVALVINGLGFSLFSSPNMNAIMGSVAKQSYGSANSIMATMRIIGQMSSMVLVTLVFAIMIGSVEITTNNYPALEQAIQMTFTIAAILCLPGVYFSLARGKVQTVKNLD